MCLFLSKETKQDKEEDNEHSNEHEERADHDDPVPGFNSSQEAQEYLHQGRLAGARRTDPAHHDPVPWRSLQPGRLRRWRSAHAGRCTVPRTAPADSSPHLERPPVLHPGCLPICPRLSPPVAALAPPCRTSGGPVWSYCWSFGAVDDPVLSPPPDWSPV